MAEIKAALKHVDRMYFVRPETEDSAHLDIPLPIGFGQTISQPTTVAYMLEWLDPAEGDRILDVGSGSGWTTALLSYLAGRSGRVYAVERIPELTEFGRLNCQNIAISNVAFYTTIHGYGLPEHAPYDKILVSAASDELPSELFSQLKVGGKLVIPIKNDIHEITKVSSTEYDVIAHPGFQFVPLEKPL